MKSCIVIFPLYQRPNKLELSFLENGIQKTSGFKQVIVAPEGLLIDEAFGDLEQLEVKRFAQHFFADIKGYNQLLLTKDFYKTFKLFDYLLIHQSDVYLFKDELQAWCDKNYDYLGAPWYRPSLLNRSSLFNFWQKIKLSFKKDKLYSQRHNKAGNGGLSLRKVNSALQVLEIATPDLLKKYDYAKGGAGNEDIFWSLVAPQLMKEFAIPNWEEALSFAIEFEPAAAYDYLGKNLPFGCHAPLKHDKHFWRKFIPAIN